MRVGTIILVSVVILSSCKSSKSICWRNWIDGKSFRNFGSATDTANQFFHIQDTVYNEYVSGKLYGNATIRWKGCDEYTLLVRHITPDSKYGLTTGDTLHVKILSIKNDTVTCSATGLSFTTEIKYFKINR